jgi:hypothetical protein
MGDRPTHAQIIRPRVVEFPLWVAWRTGYGLLRARTEMLVFAALWLNFFDSRPVPANRELIALRLGLTLLTVVFVVTALGLLLS